MKGDSEQGPDQQSIAVIARRFVDARRQCRPLRAFPGALPDNLEEAYRCQDAAISLWGHPIGGWKVGRIPPHLEARFGCDRLAGPIFRNVIDTVADGECHTMAVFDGGFAAVEAEFVAVIGHDAPADKRRWSLEETADMIADLRIGLEIASSPLSTINDIGPAAVVSDFGNNAGLIVGPSITGWRERPLDSLVCEAFVDDRLVGRGGAFQLSGGYLRSVQFMLELAAAQHRPLTAGTVIATGQTTGIHDVRIGEQARLDFGSDGVLRCSFRAAAA